MLVSAFLCVNGIVCRRQLTGIAHFGKFAGLAFHLGSFLRLG
jgi:hypothetical protein